MKVLRRLWHTRIYVIYLAILLTLLMVLEYFLPLQSELYVYLVLEYLVVAFYTSILFYFTLEIGAVSRDVLGRLKAKRLLLGFKLVYVGCFVGYLIYFLVTEGDINLTCENPLWLFLGVCQLALSLSFTSLGTRLSWADNRLPREVNDRLNAS